MEQLTKIEQAIAIHFLQELEIEDEIKWVPLSDAFFEKWDGIAYGTREMVAGFINWLADQEFVEVRPGHLSYGSRVQVRLSYAGMQRIQMMRRNWKEDDQVESQVVSICSSQN